MGRLYTLRVVLPYSLMVAKDMADVRFVLLSYNSRDGLGEWVRKNLHHELEERRLTYYETTEPSLFLMAHAKNIAAQLCDDGVICNLDADNWITTPYLKRLMEVFTNRRRIIIRSRGGACGRIALLKKHFLALGGYNEEMNLGWGYEDRDFLGRARRLLRLRAVRLGMMESQCVLPNSAAEKVAHSPLKDGEASRAAHFEISQAALRRGEYVANAGRVWGAAVLKRNFVEDCISGMRTQNSAAAIGAGEHEVRATA